MIGAKTLGEAATHCQLKMRMGRSSVSFGGGVDEERSGE
jgi:hypothetical protein